MKNFFIDMSKNFQTILRQKRQGLKRRLVANPTTKFWNETAMEPPELTHKAIAERITKNIPTCVARIGSF